MSDETVQASTNVSSPPFVCLSRRSRLSARWELTYYDGFSLMHDVTHGVYDGALSDFYFVGFVCFCAPFSGETGLYARVLDEKSRQ